MFRPLNRINIVICIFLFCFTIYLVVFVHRACLSRGLCTLSSLGVFNWERASLSLVRVRFPPPLGQRGLQQVQVRWTGYQIQGMDGCHAFLGPLHF